MQDTMRSGPPPGLVPTRGNKTKEEAAGFLQAPEGAPNRRSAPRDSRSRGWDRSGGRYLRTFVEAVAVSLVAFSSPSTATTAVQLTV